ncbi:amidohydrolase family protein [Flagellimonas hymeniacidonis]|uniref:Amidohydrolase family protein n=1 Tax=Flagellimonas hymeniacidonis TaxID=2603628 RepID=A0A5C8V8H1_9FLAO|nr:amidohydrolase family protein [Flagellimonas hymeniacidonis]TXN38245.1 amidohydrolase family protein [Flagellimonas hymeniacidonis]
MKNTILFLVMFTFLVACKPKSTEKASSEHQPVSFDQSTVQKIDIHSHYRYSREYLPGLFKKWNMRSVLVDVSTQDSTGIVRSWDTYLTHAESYPNTFFLCSSLIGTTIDSPDFEQRTIERLHKEIEEGAKMVKVWKNFGMVTKDATGDFIQIDDERLQPIWDFLKSKGIPVMAHIGEPEQAWRPLDPNNPHYGYYKNNPQYHAYQFPEIPSYKTIITARDGWIERNPDLQILCAHLGSMSHDVDMVAARLDKFPNMYVELAARFGDLASQDSKKVGDFFKKYQNKILFGSDYGNGTPEDMLTKDELFKEQEELDANYDRLWRYLSSKDSLEIRGQKTVGLELPIDILHKIYFQNAVDFLKVE